MDEFHKKMIQTNRVFIIKELQDINPVCDILFARDIINEGMLQDIEVSNIKREGGSNIG